MNMQTGMANGTIVRPRDTLVYMVVLIEGNQILQDFVVVDIVDQRIGGPPQILRGRKFIAIEEAIPNTKMGIMTLDVPGINNAREVKDEN